MIQYHEGQEVEVKHADGSHMSGLWHKAKVVRWFGPEAMRMRGLPSNSKEHYEIEFEDGTGGVFDTDHIRAKKISPVDGQYFE